MAATEQKRSPLEKLVLVINTVGFLAYLAWLMTSAGRIFYTQEGVLYLLPCLPFFFVYAFLLGNPRKRNGETEAESRG